MDYIFKKILPKQGRILEAGCGRGQIVWALQRAGYNVLGVDFSEPLVKLAKHAKPNLNIHIGDVRELCIADDSLCAYISLGVVEHYWDGMSSILGEARRVLKKEGLLLVSVPHFSPVWRKWAQKAYSKATSENLPCGANFYQFYFSKERIKRIISENGFKILSLWFYAPLYGAKRGLPFFDKVFNSSYIIRGIISTAFRLKIPQKFQQHFAHMVLIIAKKM